MLQAVEIDYRSQIEKENLSWNSLGQLIVKLPLNMPQGRLNSCIDMKRLHDFQGIKF